MKSYLDRRRSERFKYKRDVLHNTDSADLFYSGEVCNYSTWGLYFESNVDLLPGDKISVLVGKQSADGTDLVDVKIVWGKELQGSSFGFGYGATLQKRRNIDYIKNKLKGE